MYSASAVYHDRGHVELRTPYDPLFVNSIKFQIPAPYRRWDPTAKTWHVQTPNDTTAVRLLKLTFSDAHVGIPPAAPGTHPQASPACACDADHKALYVCQGAPPEAITAAYRAFAKAHHPDAGGDVATTLATNGAYERLVDEVRS